MMIIGGTLVSEELFSEQFVCDLQACKGACCVEGESGAPVETEETDRLEEVYESVKPYMRPEGIEAVERKGLYTVDTDGEFVTPLVGDHGECAFVVFENGIAKCAIEKAWLDGRISWKKPVSCHLYPVRLVNLGEFIGVNYHRWQLCQPACKCGSELKVSVFRFLREPLIRRFGEAWYAELEAHYANWIKSREGQP